VEKEEFDVSTRHETGYVIVLEPVDAFQIPASGTQALLVRPQFKFKVFPVWFRKGRGGEGRGEVLVHLPVYPLHLFHDVQTAVHDELVHVPGFFAEASDAVAALFRGAEFVLEEGIVFCADDAEIV